MMEKKKTETILHLISLEAENVLRLKAVRIECVGRDHIRITGRNDQGKTSCLHALAMALGGEVEVPPQPIHGDAEEGSIVAVLGESDKPELIVRRLFTANGSELTVSNAEGITQGTPQTILNRMLGRDGRRPVFAFRLLDFAEMEPKRQREVLLQIADIGIDLEEWEVANRDLEEQRTTANRKLKDAERADAELEPFPKDTPDEPVSTSALASQMDTARKIQAANDEERAKLKGLGQDLAALRIDIDVRQKQIEGIQERIAEMQRTLASVEHERDVILGKADDLEENLIVAQAEFVSALEDPDFDELNRRFSAAGDVNENVRRKTLARITKARLAEARKAATTAGAAVTAHREARDQALAAAKMPVQGLGISDTGVTFEGVPMEQQGDWKRLRISTAVAMAMNPRLRIVLIDRMELLDEENVALIEEMTRGKGYQIISTCVQSQPGEVGVHIVDGEVAAVDGKAVK
jgi:chaperonin cofactor prefoldin